MKKQTEKIKPLSYNRTPVEELYNNPEWSQLHDSIIQIIKQENIVIKCIDTTTVILEAVPTGKDFNKSRSNILFRKLSSEGGVLIFVDVDLAYNGTDEKKIREFNGFHKNNWRCITHYPYHDNINKALCFILDIIDSPLTEQTYQELKNIEKKSQHINEQQGDNILDVFGESVSPATSRKAYHQTFRKELATQIAITLKRTQSPNSVILWGDSGVGKKLMMFAAIDPLFRRQKIDRAFSISGSKIALGHIFPSEIDNILYQVLSRSIQLNYFLLIHDIDVCLTETKASKSIFCEAIDKGLRFLATVRDDYSMKLWAKDKPFARRILPIQIQQPSLKNIRKILQEISNKNTINVQPAAIESILKLSKINRETVCEPSWSIGMLSAAITQAKWNNSTQIDPDSVYSVLKAEWPQL